MGQLRPGDRSVPALHEQAPAGRRLEEPRDSGRHRRCRGRVAILPVHRRRDVVLPRRWRPLSADRIRRPTCSISICVSACTRWRIELRAAALPGIIDLTPGVRSLQVHYDTRYLRRETPARGAGRVRSADSRSRRHLMLPSRIVHLPLSWDDPATRLAIRKYMQSVRPDAPWCPSNIEFIRRINGLGLDRRRAATSCSTPAIWCSGWATFIWARRSRRRSIRGTGWSRRSTIRRAPGRRRMRSASAALICACTAWKVRADISSSAARCRCGTRSTTEFSPARLAAALLRSDPFLPGERGRTAGDARRRFRMADIRCASKSSEFRLREYHAFLESIEPERGATSRAASRRRSRPSANAGRWRARISSWTAATDA